MIRFFNRQISKWKLLLLAGDLAAYWLATIIAVLINPKVGPTIPDCLAFLQMHWSSFTLIGFSYILVFYMADLYDYRTDFRRLKNLIRLIITVGIGTLTVIVLYYFPLGIFLGRILLLIMASFFTVLLVTWRWFFSALALPERLKSKVLVVGAGEAGRSLLSAVRRRPGCGLEPVGFVDDDPQKQASVIDGLPVIGGTAELLQIIKEYKIDLVVVAITHEKSPALVSTLTRLSWNGLEVQDMPTIYEFLAGKIPVEHISDLWLMFNSLNKNMFYLRYVKRPFDLAMAILVMILVFPLFIFIPLAIKLGDSGPVFFCQERLGLAGRTFKIIKFRTMVPDAERHGPQWARESDPRVTRVGRILRQLRLDELPQLVNILKGDMSFIGPRPERDVFVKEFQKLVPVWRSFRLDGNTAGVRVCNYVEKVPYYSYRLLVKPGLTGWAQVMYPYTSSLEQTMEKLKYDLYYIKNLSLFLDLAILLKTFRIILFGRGI